MASDASDACALASALPRVAKRSTAAWIAAVTKPQRR
jgi:hypothetical protein